MIITKDNPISPFAWEPNRVFNLLEVFLWRFGQTSIDGTLAQILGSIPGVYPKTSDWVPVLEEDLNSPDKIVVSSWIPPVLRSPADLATLALINPLTPPSNPSEIHLALATWTWKGDGPAFLVLPHPPVFAFDVSTRSPLYDTDIPPCQVYSSLGASPGAKQFVVNPFGIVLSPYVIPDPSWNWAPGDIFLSHRSVELTGLANMLRSIPDILP
jgi:hypothetical protein